MNFKSYSCRYDFRKEKFTNDLVERNKRQSRLLKARTNAKLHQGSGAIVLTLESIPFCPINHPHNPFNPSKVRGCSEYCWQLNLSRSGISQHLGENLYQIVRAKQANKIKVLKCSCSKQRKTLSDVVSGSQPSSTRANGKAISINDNMPSNVHRTFPRLYSYSLRAHYSWILFFMIVCLGFTVTTSQDVDLSLPLPASKGFRILGATVGGNSGNSVSNAGDVNGDNIDDMIIGALKASPLGQSAAGITYVIFGRNVPGGATPFSDIQLTTGGTAIPSNIGFRILGASANQNTGTSVKAAGDVNGDNIGDIIIGAAYGDPTAAYVIFGRSAATQVTIPFNDIQLTTSTTALSASIGFRILRAAAGDFSGWAVSGIGDVNKDGVDDVIVGAYQGDPTIGTDAGISYVVFGRNIPGGAAAFGDIQLPTTAMLASIGFRIRGAASGDFSGRAVSRAGDVNGDGVADILVGSYRATPTGKTNAGIAYVIFGRDIPGGAIPFPDFQLTTGATPLASNVGFRILGASAGYSTGYAVSAAGDVNNDGIDDVIVGAYQGDPTTGTDAGISYVVFGRNIPGGATAFGDIQLSTLPMNPSVGFRIFGAAAGDRSGYSVSAAGDVNGDNVDDIIIGSINADPTGRTDAGAAYVIFGRSAAAQIVTPFGDIDLAVGANPFPISVGFRILGDASLDSAGYSVSAAGDINGDGVGDVLVGAYNADPPGYSDAGISYVILGAAMQPTSLPSSQPSRQPSRQPSGQPTSQPSRQTVALPTSQPSRQPTRQPSNQPSTHPSKQPTSQPSHLPSMQPATQPSIMPTAQPSTQPSNSPSTLPSSQPSNQPSMQPSAQPFSKPSSLPSAQPSRQPSAVPSTQPWSAPSALPPMQPSSIPTLQPSSQPSGQPSTQPSVQPSSQPSVQSSTQPTSQPSAQPSLQPLSCPSVQPTTQPSNEPSSRPTTQPSRQPTANPSHQPSCQPSAQPSVQPSPLPSTQPSAQPSSQPSLQPSVQPSSQPSSQPSMQPSQEPSAQPSSQPSAQPSIQPSGQPTQDPTAQPSSQPSGQPSTQPSMQPSCIPSAQPSQQPSAMPTTEPSAQPSNSPSAQPTVAPSLQPVAWPSAQPSQQPSSRPSVQPSTQPSTQPSNQPSVQPSGQPSCQPTSVPTVVPGEWIRDLPGGTDITSKLAYIHNSLWSCGMYSSDETSSYCTTLDAVLGVQQMWYSFPWTSITTTFSAGDTSKVVVSGSSVSSETVSAELAICTAIPNYTQFTCAALSILDSTLVAGSYASSVEKLVYIGEYNEHATVTLLWPSGIIYGDFWYSNANMKFIAFRLVQSIPNYVGSFIVGICSNSALRNFIFAGIVRTDSGSMSAMYLAPMSGFILNSGELVNAMAMEYVNPDTFIAGGLQLSDGAGMHAYMVCINSLYNKVIFGMRYIVRGSGDNRRRLVGGTNTYSSVVKGMALVQPFVYMLVQYTDPQLSNNSQCVAILKTHMHTGRIVQQVQVYSKNASIECTDFSNSDLSFALVCTVRYVGNNSQELVVSVNKQLTFSKLPMDFARYENDVFQAESVAFKRTLLPLTVNELHRNPVNYAFNLADSRPTLRPSTTPTYVPSKPTTAAPSGQPSSSPTAAPSVSPQPTSQPSSSGPTNTHKPTVKPTQRPSRAPSVNPTASPTVSPTPRPTSRPSASPSVVPSRQPSTSPTVKPTRNPTVKASHRPSMQPTIQSSTATIAPTAPIVTAAALGNNNHAYAIFGYIVAGLFGALCLYSLRWWCQYKLERVQSDANRAVYVESMGEKAKPRFPIVAFVVSLCCTVEGVEVGFVAPEKDDSVKQKKATVHSKSLDAIYSGTGANIEDTLYFRDLEANTPVEKENQNNKADSVLASASAESMRSSAADEEESEEENDFEEWESSVDLEYPSPSESDDQSILSAESSYSHHESDEMNWNGNESNDNGEDNSSYYDDNNDDDEEELLLSEESAISSDYADSIWSDAMNNSEQASEATYSNIYGADQIHSDVFDADSSLNSHVYFPTESNGEVDHDAVGVVASDHGLLFHLKLLDGK